MSSTKRIVTVSVTAAALTLFAHVRTAGALPPGPPAPSDQGYTWNFDFDFNHLPVSPVSLGLSLGLLLGLLIGWWSAKEAPRLARGTWSLTLRNGRERRLRPRAWKTAAERAEADSAPVCEDDAEDTPGYEGSPVIPLAAVARELRRAASTAELLGMVAPLSARAGLARLRVEHEILPPGRRSSSPHAHTTREELVYVLSGTPDLWVDGHVHRMGADDAAGFPAGTGIAHAVLNNSDEDVELLVIASEPGDDACLYPLATDAPVAEAGSLSDVPARVGGRAK